MEKQPKPQLFDNTLSTYLFIVLGVVIIQALILSYLANEIIDFRLLLSAGMTILTVLLLGIIIFSPLTKTKNFIDFQNQKIKEIGEKSQNDLQNAQQNYLFLENQHQKSQYLLIDYAQNANAESLLRYAQQLMGCSAIYLWQFENDEVHNKISFKEDKISQINAMEKISFAQINEIPKFSARNLHHSTLQNFPLKKYLAPTGLLVHSLSPQNRHAIIIFEYQIPKILQENHEKNANYLAAALSLHFDSLNKEQNINFLIQKNNFVRQAFQKQNFAVAAFLFENETTNPNKNIGLEILQNKINIKLETYNEKFAQLIPHFEPHHLFVNADNFTFLAYEKLLPKFFEKKMQSLAQEHLLPTPKQEKRYFSIFLSPILENNAFKGWLHVQQDINHIVISGQEQSEKLRKSRAYQKVLQKLAECEGEKFWQNTPLLSENLEQMAHILGFSQTSFWKIQHNIMQNFLRYNKELKQFSAPQEQITLPFGFDDYKYKILDSENLENLDLENFNLLYQEKFTYKYWLILPIHLQNKALMLFMAEADRAIFLSEEVKSLLTSFARQLGNFLQQRQNRLEIDFLKYKTEIQKQYFQSFPYGVAIFELQQPISTQKTIQEQAQLLAKAQLKDCNLALEKMLNLEKHNLLDKTLHNFALKPNEDETQIFLEKLIEKNYKLTDSENIVTDSEGNKVQYLKNITCLVRQNQIWGLYYEQHALKVLDETTFERLENEKNLSLLLENQNAISILLDENAKYLYFPDSFAQQFSYSPNEIARKPIADFFMPEVWDKIWTEVIANPSLSMSYTSKFLDAKGVWADVKLDFYYQTYKGISLNISDITEQTQQEQAVAFREMRWEKIGKVQKSWAIIDLQKNVIFANEAFQNWKIENIEKLFPTENLGELDSFLENLYEKSTIILAFQNQQRHLIEACPVFLDGQKNIYLEFSNIETDLLEKEKLFQRAEFFESIAQSSQQAWAILDEKGNFVYANPIFSVITEFSEEEICKRNLFELAAVESFGESLKFFERAFAEKNTQKLNFYLQSKSENKLFVESYLSYLLDNEQVKGFLFEFREMTSYKENFDRLAHNEQNLRLLCDSSQQMLALATDYGKWLYHNRAASWLAYSQKEWTMPFAEAVLHPESTDAARKMWQKALAGDNVTQMLRLNHNGNYLEIKCNLQNIKTDKRSFIVADFEDLTEKIGLQSEITWLEEQLENLEKYKNEVLQKQIWESKWQQALREQEFEKITQMMQNKQAQEKQEHHEKVQNLEKNHAQTLAQIQEQNQVAMEKLTTEKNTIIEQLHEKIKVLYQNLSLAEQSAVLGRQIDSIAQSLEMPLRESVHHFEALRFYINDLEELLDKYQEISPEINLEEKLQEINHLKAIIAYENLLERIYGLVDKQIQGLLLTAKNSEYLQKLATFSAQKQEIILSDLLEIVLGLLSKKLQNIELVKKYAHQGKIAACESQIAQVFIHLLNNAAEAMPKGGYLFLTLIEQAEQVMVSFRDTGGGMPKILQEKIGEAFVSNKSGHLGLGLFWSKKIISEHEGELLIKSESSEGTEVIILLEKTKKVSL